MKPTVVLVILAAVTGGGLGTRGTMLGVPGTVSVPLTVVAGLVVFTGLSVWAFMSARRLAVHLGRLRRRNRELAAELGSIRAAGMEADKGLREAQGEVRSRDREAEELQGRVKALERILADAARLNATRSLVDLPERLTAAVRESTGFDKVVLYLWSDGTGAFQARGFAGLSEQSVVRLTDLQVSREEFESTCRGARARGGCYIVDRQPGDPTLWATGETAEGRWSADRLLLIPLMTPSGETLGYMTMDDPRNGRMPAAWEIRQLEFLVYQGAIALESARAFDLLARNNAELSHASDKLGSLAQMKANFVANVSHELRTPLTSISAYAELLQTRMDHMTETESREFLNVIHHESVKLSEIIDDILEVNEMDSGRPELTQAETDLVSLIRHLEDSWRTRARERDIEFVVVTSSDRIPLTADPAMLNQMLSKLVGNAFKFNRDGGKVEITVEETGTAVRIKVEDTGIGIPEAELGRIFERFYQVDSSPTREHNGQGLGLAICHDIVTHHDGRIWAENIKPHGARFTVLLPRRPAVHQSVTSAPGLQLTVEPGEFVARVMHWVAESMGVRNATLMMPIPGLDQLGIRAAIGMPESVVQSARIRRGMGVAGRVWASGKSLLVQDVGLDKGFRGGHDASSFQTPSLLCVPLKRDGQVFGVLAVNNRHDGRPLGDDDRLLLEALAPRLGKMLHEFTRLHRRACEYEMVRDSLRSLTPVGNLPAESVLDVCREICLSAGRRIHMSAEDLQHLAFTLCFYDVGMSCVPPQLLNHPGPLSDDEMLFVRRHVQVGLEILDPLMPESRIRQLVLHHHENFDGSGYPDGLAGEAIPLGARLIRLTDTLAALLSPRPYRPSFSLDAALAEMRKGIGTEFCPRMADVFFSETLRRRQRIEALQDLPGDHLDLARPGLDQRGMVTVKV
ncbi:hypothetical protein COW53_03185 [bacterium CG17_big_fil_post_rev_8_21_14_2_50_64_8]|nr:MAG: hypothetical protein COW53_03185 [bacterium CG17_big_fil_post_rev_8_21_14_2_50_64_8]PJA75048.1 MAG: hypothetical protein CO151_07635 [bacterium CG_4_9_14_3_um_filter_65_15]